MGIALVAGTLLFLGLMLGYPRYRPATKRLTWIVGLLVLAGFARLLIGLAL